MPGPTIALRAVETRDCSAALCLCFNRAMADFLEGLSGVNWGSEINSAWFSASVAGCSDGIATWHSCFRNTRCLEFFAGDAAGVWREAVEHNEGVSVSPVFNAATIVRNFSVTSCCLCHSRSVDG